ncbi:MAG: hypothetical protein IT458_02085 [Planctomycetes bacterium]|nr:hypothetical protein [Planctomycetota bacterium]
MEHDLGRLGRRTLLALNVLAGVTAAVLVVLHYLVPERLGYPALIPGVPIGSSGHVILVPLRTTAATLGFVAAVALLVVDLLWLIYGRQRRHPLRHVLSEAPGGTVRITRDALEAALRSAGEALPEVARLRVMLAGAGPKRIVVKVQFQAPEGVANLDASRALRAALQQRFQEMVRLTDGQRVEYDLEFLGFSGKGARKAEAAAPAAEPDAPFTGPKYPIEDEDDPYESKRSV